MTAAASNTPAPSLLGPTRSTGKPGIIKKLTDAMGAIERLKKEGHNKQFDYTFVREADVVDAVRKEFSARSILMVPRIMKCDLTPVNSTKGSGGTQCYMEVNFEFTDGDTGEILEVMMPGMAVDFGVGDKSIYKALSGATKYVLLKLLLIATGDDDPESTTGERAPDKKKAPPPNPPLWDRLVEFASALGLSKDALRKITKDRAAKLQKPKLDDTDRIPVQTDILFAAFGGADTQEKLARLGTLAAQLVRDFSEDQKQAINLMYNNRLAELPAMKAPPEPGSNG